MTGRKHAVWFLVVGMAVAFGGAFWLDAPPSARAEGGGGPSGSPASPQGPQPSKCTSGERVGPPPDDTVGTCAKCNTPTSEDVRIEIGGRKRRKGGTATPPDEPYYMEGDAPTPAGIVQPHNHSVRRGLPFPWNDGDCSMPGPPEGGGGLPDWEAPDLSATASQRPTLVYDSQISLNRMTGNWWCPWDIYVVPQQNGDLKFYQPGRAGDTYVWNALSQTFVSPPGYFDQMVQNPNGTWTRTTKHGVVWQFNVAGHIDWIRDRYGLQTTFNRNAQTNQLLTVTDYAGRVTTISYYPNGYVSSVADWGGNTTSLTYTVQGYVATITYPATTYFDRATGTTVTRGRTLSFQYMTNTGNSNLDGNLTSIADDAGYAEFAATYDAQDRVLSASSYGKTWTFQPTGGGTLVTAPDGMTTLYGFNANGAITRKEVFTQTGLGQQALRQNEPNSYVWTYGRTDPCGCDLLTQITRPDGSTSAMQYDSWGNLLSRVESPPSGSLDPVRTETWTYSSFAQYCLVLTHTKPSGYVQGANPTDHTTTWSRDGLGNATAVSYPKATVNGTLTTPTRTFTFNLVGLPLTKTDFNGMVTKYEYAPITLELVKETRDFGTGTLNLLTQFGYDSFSRLTSVTDPRGNTSTIQYNALGQVTETQGPTSLAGRIRYTYDNEDLIHMVEVENKDAYGNQITSNPWFTTTYSHNSSNQLEYRTVEVDATTTATTQYSYTSGGRPWKTTDPMGNVTEQVFDERGLLFTVTEGYGTSVAGTTTYNYDVNGNLSSVVSPRGYSTTYVANHEGWVVSQTDPAGTKTVNSYDINGIVTQVEARNAQGTPLTRQAFQDDPYGLRTSSSQFIVDAQGNVVQTLTTTYTFNSALKEAQVTDPLNNSLTYTYDAVGRLTQVQDAASNKEVVAYDGADNETTRTFYSWNQVTSAYDVVVFDSQFDVLNRRTQTTRRDQGNMSSTARSWTYDSRGNVLGETDEVGNTRHFAYDGLSLRTSETIDLRAGGTGTGQVTSTIVTQSTYDLAGRVTAMKDGLNQQTTYAYDARGRLSSETNAAGGVRMFTYDSNGNLLTVTDPVGNVVTNTHDNRDQLTARSVARATGVLGTTSESYTYDALGRVLTAVDNDSTVQYAYDSIGRVLTETEGPNPLGSSGKTFAYGYNSVGSMNSITFPDGTLETRGRDAIQRLTSVAVQGGPTLANYQYSGWNVIQLALQNGVTRTGMFDLLRRQTIVEYKQGSTSLRKFEYVFNKADYRLLEKRHHAGGTGDNYILDSLYRTVNVKEGVADPVLEHQTPGSQTFATSRVLTYDAAQNRTQVAVTPSGGSTTTTSYTADALNFYTAVGATAQIRDANGNLRDDGTMLYDYDYRNQLCKVTHKATSAVIATCDYDAHGRRIAKTASTTTTYFWALEAMAMEFDASGQLSRRHFGVAIDEVVSSSQRDLADLNNNGSTTDAVWLTPAYDGAMDCAAVFGPTGAIAESYVHSYQGAVTIANGAGQTIATSALAWNQGYAGMHRDDETGFLYARLRYYSPTMGRFVTSDSMEAWFDPSGLGNRYCWIGNAYRQGVDPWGLCKMEVVFKPMATYPSSYFGVHYIRTDVHAFILTTDPDGGVTISRGGPEANVTGTGSSPASSTATQPSGIHGFGQLIAQQNPYRRGSPDRGPGFENWARVTVLDVPGNCCEINKKLRLLIEAINKARAKYRPFGGPNSNSAVSFMLVGMGIPIPSLPKLENSIMVAPGYNRRLDGSSYGR